MGQMTVVTCGYVMVVAGNPPLKNLIHGVTVHTCFRVAAEVGKAPGIYKRVYSKSKGYAENEGDTYPPGPAGEEDF